MLALGGFAAGLLLLGGDRALQRYLASTVYNWSRVLWCVAFGLAPFLIWQWVGGEAALGFIVGGAVGWVLGPRVVRPRHATGAGPALRGWLLVEQDPDDPLPDEARRLSALADERTPSDPLTLLLHSVIAVHDGDLTRATSTLDRVDDLTGYHAAARDSLRAIVAYRRGEHAEAGRLLAGARSLDPGCDVLVVTERELGGGRALAGH